MFTVMGSDAQMVIPSARLRGNAFAATMNRENPKTMPETAPKLKSWRKALNLNRWNAFANSSVLIPMPARTKMNITASQVAVIWGAR